MKETELRARAEAAQRKRVEQCVKEVLPLLSKYNVELVPQVSISGGQIVSQVLFKAKD